MKEKFGKERFHDQFKRNNKIKLFNSRQPNNSLISFAIFRTSPLRKGSRRAPVHFSRYFDVFLIKELLILPDRR